MKILIPTAKEMNLSLSGQPMLGLPPKSQAILDCLMAYDQKELAQFYKMKPEATCLEAERLDDLATGQARVYPAWQLFDGLMYRQMQRTDLSKEAESYLAQHVFITSAFYGVINVFDLISPHRLDFLMGLKPANQSLKAFWRDDFAQAVAEDDLIISLLSSEFETVFPKIIQDRMIKLTFMEERGGQLKGHSTISKKARGKCLNELVADQVTDVEILKALSFDGFTYRPDLSEARHLVFVKKLG